MSNEERDETSQIQKSLESGKKKMMMIIVVSALLIISIGGFFGFKYTETQNAIKKQQEEKLKTTPIKDLVVDDADKDVVYSRDVEKQNYMLTVPDKNAIRFAGTIIFYNKYAEKLYDGNTNYAAEISGEESSASDTATFGDKLVKDTVISFFGRAKLDEINTREALAESLKNAINERYKKDYEQEIVKSIFITDYFIA